MIRSHYLISLLFGLLVASICFSCSKGERGEVMGRVNGKLVYLDGDSESNFSNFNKRMITVNQTLLIKETQQIKSYIERRAWDMKMLPTGVRIWEYEKGDEQRVKPLNRITMAYTLELINGDTVYSSAKDGLKTFVVDQPGTEKGLMLAVQSLSKGSRAKIIIPSAQGFGLYGDEKSIPRNAILIYDVTIMQVETSHNEL